MMPLLDARTGGLLAAVVVSMALAGCGEGEVTTLILPVSPDNGPEFAVAQRAMLTMGCGIVGCHATTVGNFQVSGEPGAVQDEYLLSKAAIDQAAPGDSVLLRVALTGDPIAVGRHPFCFANTEGCGWRIITAWIADGEPTASAVADMCPVTDGACFSGGD